jgi:hypothetical protein
MSSPESLLAWPLRFGGRGHLGISQSRNQSAAVGALPGGSAIDPHRVVTSQAALSFALAVASLALRLAMERLVSPVRERPVSVAMPSIKAASDLIAAAAALSDAVAGGDITPNEASSLSNLVGNTAKAIETFELSERPARLEEQISAKGSAP